MAAPLLAARGLSKTFQVTKGLFIRRAVDEIRAVDDVSLEVFEGETLGCVGGSGSGKTTLGRLILRLIEPDAGEVTFSGKPITSLSQSDFRPFRREMQIVFQDPLQSLNPRRTVVENVERPLLNFGVGREEARERVAELLTLVGIDPAHAYRYPHEYSGGQCQRIAIARSLALKPRFLLLDEPVSALDVSIQAQILNLLKDLQRRLNLTYLFISHDLKLVRQFCDRTVVMYRGRILEGGRSDAIYNEPRHPFSRDFLGTVLHLRKDSRWEVAAERAEDLEDITRGSRMPVGTGCVYAQNCTDRIAPCTSITPRLLGMEDGRQVACHLYDPESTAEVRSRGSRLVS